MDRTAIFNVIQNIFLFKDISETNLRRLADMIEIRTLPADTFLFKENNPRKALYIIVEGKIELSREDAFGGERRPLVFGKNDFLGEGALLDDSPHYASARAIDPTVALQITREKFADWYKQDVRNAAAILGRIVRIIARRMQRPAWGAVSEAAQYISGRTRTEHDLLGERSVPHGAYYGIQTLRGLENFPITGVPISHFPELIEALALVKMAAARANTELGLIPADVGEAIDRAGAEILNGKLHNQFVVDTIQGGAGTSTNMNANEVIANRAIEFLGHKRGEYQYCHPNNHVNFSQSTNDAYPSALKIAIINGNKRLVNVLRELIASFHAKATEFEHVIKIGRTQLQDAVPMTLGQEFEAYAVSLSDEIERLNGNAAALLELNLGGTAIGTGLNTAAEFGSKAVEHLRELSGLDVQLAHNLIEETQDTGSFVMYSSALRLVAIKLSKICNDLRLLSSGPRAGFNEINLPRMQPGSSIMPGKVNPVIPEVVNQIAFKVIGNDTAVTLAAEAGQLELNVMEPVIAEGIFESIAMLKNGITALKQRCIDGITANEDRCREYALNSIGLVTALNPVLGYETSSQLAKEALDTNRSIYELVLEKNLLSRERLDTLLNPQNMLHPQVVAHPQVLEK